MLGRLRERYQKAIAPVGVALVKTGISPNAMTLLSLLIAVLSGLVYAIREPIAGASLVVFASVLDMFDGAIARAMNGGTRFGATFDHVVDRYAEFFIVFGIIYGKYCDWTVGSFTLFGMLMASFTRAKAESVGGLRSCTVGIAERQEKLLLFIVGSILTPFFIDTLYYATLLVGVLSHITVVQRLRYTWIQTREGKLRTT